MTDHPREFGYVYACYDPAIRDEILKYCEERFGKGNYFFNTDPGAAKNIVAPHSHTDTDFVIWKMQLAANVHPYTTLLVINHSLCGAYADSGVVFESAEAESEYHKDELMRAVAILKTKIPPDVTIETHYFLKKEQQFAW